MNTTGKRLEKFINRLGIKKKDFAKICGISAVHLSRILNENLKYTQKQVADAVGTSVRTYQKWESGETTPDGHFLIRLINWLDILNIQETIKYIAM